MSQPPQPFPPQGQGPQFPGGQEPYGPYQSPQAPAMQPATGGTPGGVIAVAVVNFILGALDLIAGICVLTGAGMLGVAGQQAMGKDMPAQQAEQVQALAFFGGAILFVIAIVLFLIGAAMITAGVGLLKRRNWARVLTLIIAGVAVLMALTSLINLQLLGAIIYGGYAAMAFAILLNREVAAHFR